MATQDVEAQAKRGRPPLSAVERAARAAQDFRRALDGLEPMDEITINRQLTGNHEITVADVRRAVSGFAQSAGGR